MNTLLQTLRMLLPLRRSDRGGARPQRPPTYRLRAMPRADKRFSGAEVQELLGTLRVRAVTRHWIQWKTGMDSAQVDDFLAWLAAQHVLEPVRLDAIEPCDRPATLNASLAVV